MCKSDPLIAYGVTKGKRDGRRFRVVMIPHMPESALPDFTPLRCDICNRPARRFDGWSVYCEAHWPEFAGWQVEGS